MCTVIILRRPDHRWPLLMGANRDERMDRPWKLPDKHWPDRPDVVAGLDELGGGSWLGINELGVTACILNRRGTLGPQDGKRSRGEIVLDALDHEDANVAAESLSHLDGTAFRDFNLVIADNRDAFWLKLDTSQSNSVSVTPIPEGYSMFTAGNMNDPASERIARFLPQFKEAPVPTPEQEDWSAWQALLSTGPETNDPMVAMCFHTDSGFGTSSSALIALPSPEAAIADPPAKVSLLFSEGPPDSEPYQPITLS